MDDHIRAAIFFEAMFNFLHKYYFPRTCFGPVYLAPYKTFVFTDQIDFVGFTKDKNELRPSMKHRDRIQHWPVATSRAEVEVFLWLTPFLHIFIPGRAQHALIIKQSYLEEVNVELERISHQTLYRSLRLRKYFHPRVRYTWEDFSMDGPANRV